MPNTIILNSVIDAQAKRQDGRARVALLILSAMEAAEKPDVQPNTITYTSAIDCCGKCDDGDGATAVQLLDRMVRRGLKPNQITYGSVISAQAKRGSAQMASSVLKQMIAAGLQPSVVAFNAVLDAHGKCDDGSAAEALLLFESMPEHNLKANIITITSAIAAQAKQKDGSAETAAQLLEKAVLDGIRPDKVTFTTVLDAQAKRCDGSSHKAARILEMMKKSSFVRPNRIHFNSALNACATARPADICTAQKVLKFLEEDGLAPNEYTLSALLRCCAFSEPAHPELAAKLFEQFAPALEVNDHIKRALFLAVSEPTAENLLRSVGVSPTDGRRRRSSSANNRRSGSFSFGTTASHRGSWRKNLGAMDEAYGSASTATTSSSSDEDDTRGAQSCRRIGPPGRNSFSAFNDSLMAARRLSLGVVDTTVGHAGGRRNSLAGAHALEAAAAPRLSREAVTGITSVLTNDKISSSSVSPSPLGAGGGAGGVRRLSLAEKVKQIKANAAVESTAPLAQEKLICESDSSKGGRHSGLLSPNFFTEGKSQQGGVDTHWVPPTLHRMPIGPDGTRGFSARGSRSSSVARMPLQELAE